MKIALHELTHSPFSEFSQKLKKLCAPLFKQYHLNYFDYARFYPNMTCWTLFTDPQYVDFFTQHPVYTTPSFLRPTGAYLWAGYIPPEFLEQASDGFNYYHGLTLVTRTPEYVETVSLGAPATEIESLNFFLNERPFIQLFIKYLVNEVMKEEKQLTSSRIILPNALPAPSPAEESPKPNLILDEIAALTHQRKNHNLMLVGETLVGLSDREKQCIEYLRLGYSNKLIARTLEISHRTIEKYFEKVYEKCNLNGRNDLVRALMLNHTS
jgi:DNA-binding CsgD family transcriptional regulator